MTSSSLQIPPKPRSQAPTLPFTHIQSPPTHTHPNSRLPPAVVVSSVLLFFNLHELDMSVRLSRSLPLPPRSSPREEEKLGIVTVLGCDPGTAARAPSLRRTLSADMSSKKWLEENGFHPLKKAASSFSIEDSSSEDDEEDALRKDVEGCGGRVYLWKARRDAVESGSKPGETWGSILFQKVEDSNSLPPPYVHPMVKRSKSCLSTRSLEICTESLGSETGSDGFSSSENGDVEDGHEEHRQDRVSSKAADFDVFYMPKYNHTRTAEKMRPRSFPPPIKSLSTGDCGGSLSMHSRRDNGRLIVEAVSIPSERNFEARRQEGRLVLTFKNKNKSCSDDDDDDDDEEMDGEEGQLVMEMDEEMSDEEEEPEEDEERVFDTETIAKLLSKGAMNIHKPKKPLNKLITATNRNANWQGKFGGAFDSEEYEEEDWTLLKQSLPLKSMVARMLSTPRVVPSTATEPESLNAYEYFWRTKASANTFIASIAQPFSTLQGQSLTIPAYGKNLQPNAAGGYISPLLQSCNSPSRTNLLWEPKCITTS